MSYILDALKKSEREKALGKIPTLETVVSNSGLQGTKFQIPLWVNLLIFLIALLSIIFTLYWLGFISLPSDRQKQARNTTQIETNSQEASAIKIDDISQAERLDINKELNDGLLAGLRSAETTIGALNKLEVVSDKQTKGASLIDISPDLVEPEITQETKIITPGLSTQTAAKELGANKPVIEATLMSEQSEEITAPEYSTSLPQALRNIGVNLVSYSGDQLRRFVMLDMTIFKEGDSLKSGVQIIEVQRTGVVVQYKGEKYFLKPS